MSGGRAVGLGAAAGALALVVACASAPAPGLDVSPSTPDPVAGMLRSMPAPSARQENELAARMLATPDAVPILVGMLGSPTADDDAAARYALASLGRWVTRAGAEADRHELAAALAVELEREHPVQVRRFLIERLGLVGGPESVSALSESLPDPELGDDAVRALVAIGGPEATSAVAASLASGDEPSVQMILAAGRLRIRSSAPALREGLNGGDADMRLASATALADLAEPGDGEALLAALDGAAPAARRRLAPHVLRYGTGRARSGDEQEGTDVAAAVLHVGAASGDDALSIAALRTLADLSDSVAAEALAGFDAPDSPRVAAVVDEIRSGIERRRRERERAEEEARQGFVSLFDGQSLDGWVGATDGYFVQDGAIVCDPEVGGNLYTEGEYADFVLRFEFRLTPGANNGLGIRAPLEGDAAYVGMELQILDNDAVEYADLHPYQYHGSVYGVAPAERGHLKPVGQWNEQEVVAEGRRVRVVLNGATILDVDLDEVSRPRTADGRDHPGLARASGHIGFLGHGHRVEFRHIRIRDEGHEER